MTAGFDAGTPNMARIYDYLLDGKDHYAADRAQARQLLQTYPPLAQMARDNRAFLARAVSWAAGQGISQFLDLGAGLPATPSTCQIARAVIPAARVAYIDTDPVVLAHARALLATPGGVTAAAADLTDPAAVLAHPDLRDLIDPAEPACVILGAVLHFLDAPAARRVTTGYARRLAAGSCLIISVARFDDQTLAKQLAAEYTPAPFVNHDPGTITSFLAGLDIIGPGLADARTWRPWTSASVPHRRTGHILAAVARVPQQSAAPARPESRDASTAPGRQ